MGWSVKPRAALLLAVIGLVAVGLPDLAAGGNTQLAGCSDVNSPTFSESEAAYPDAMNLAQTLINHHFTVTCVSPSKMTDTFEGQTGAAVYRTKEGEFEALFLPKPQTFDKLRVIERRDGQRYRYSFEGRPKPWPANLIDSAYRLYFVKHGNELIVAQDRKVASRIKVAINGH